MNCRPAKSGCKGREGICSPSSYKAIKLMLLCLKLKGFLPITPLKASLSTNPITTLLGNCPKNKFSLIAVRFPCGMVKDLTSTLRRGYFAEPSCRALMCPMRTALLGLTFRQYKLTSFKETLKFPSPCKQKKCSWIE